MEKAQPTNQQTNEAARETRTEKELLWMNCSYNNNNSKTLLKQNMGKKVSVKLQIDRIAEWLYTK